MRSSIWTPLPTKELPSPVAAVTGLVPATPPISGLARVCRPPFSESLMVKGLTLRKPTVNPPELKRARVSMPNCFRT